MFSVDGAQVVSKLRCRLGVVNQGISLSPPALLGLFSFVLQNCAWLNFETMEYLLRTEGPSEAGTTWSEQQWRYSPRLHTSNESRLKGRLTSQ